MDPYSYFTALTIKCRTFHDWLMANALLLHAMAEALFECVEWQGGWDTTTTKDGTILKSVTGQTLIQMSGVSLLEFG